MEGGDGGEKGFRWPGLGNRTRLLKKGGRIWPLYVIKTLSFWPDT